MFPGSRIAVLSTMTVVCCLRPTRAEAQLGVGIDLMRPPTTERRVEVRDALPQWVVVPSTARILTSTGIRMQPVKNSAVTLENARIGFLVGALRNVGRCARNVTVRLQYTDEYWRPVGAPAENEARVTRVDPDGLLPYRFRLARRDAFEDAPSGYILQIFEDDQPVAKTIEWVTADETVDTSACEPDTLGLDTAVTRGRSTLSGYRVQGRLTVRSGGPVRTDGLTLTALLLDGDGDVLEVLTGVPDSRKNGTALDTIPDGTAVPFTLSTPIPLGKAVATTVIFAEALPGAQVARPE